MGAVGVVLIGHGTKYDEGIEEFHRLSNLIRMEVKARWQEMNPRNEELVFSEGFLELSHPDIPAALEACYLGQVRAILVVPLLLFEAGHMKYDIPRIIQSTCRARVQDVPVELLPPVGVDPAFIQVAAARLAETGFVPHQDALLLVGRGNKDRDAQQAFQEVADSLSREIHPAAMENGYLAGHGPRWEVGLLALLRAGFKRIHIQPYLWFHGWLTAQLPAWVTSVMHNNEFDSSVQIRMTDPLGVHPVLVTAMADRILTALAARSSS